MRCYHLSHQQTLCLLKCVLNNTTTTEIMLDSLLSNRNNILVAQAPADSWHKPWHSLFPLFSQQKLLGEQLPLHKAHEDGMGDLPQILSCDHIVHDGIRKACQFQVHLHAFFYVSFNVVCILLRLGNASEYSDTMCQLMAELPFTA